MRRIPGRVGVLLQWACVFCLVAGNSSANDGKISAALDNKAPIDHTVSADAVMRFPTGDVKAGKKLYKRYCRGCHGVDGRGGAHTFMPHVGKLTKKGYIDLVPDSFMYLVIAKGGEAVGKNSYMPAWDTTLSETQIKDVIAFVRSLRLH